MLKRQPSLLFSATLILSDLLMSGLAFGLAYRLRLLSPHEGILPFSNYAGMMAVHVLSIVTVFFLNKAYHQRHPESHLDEFYSVSGNVFLGTVTAIALISFLFKNQLDYPRLMMVYALVLTIVLVTLGRVIHARIQWILLARGVGRRKVLLVGSGDVGRLILQKIRQSPRLGYEVVGFVNGEAGSMVMGVPVLGQTEDLPTLIEDHGVQEVIIGLPEASHQEILDIISLCERERVGIKVFPDVFQILSLIHI